MRKIELDEREIVRQYKSGNSAIVIAEIQAVSSTYIYNILKQYGVECNSYNASFDVFEKHRKQILKRYYEQGESLTKIASTYKYSGVTLSKYFVHNGLKIRTAAHIRKYKFNERYFDVPNVNNSYWAGFIAADGNVNDKNQLRINLSTKDENILYRFKHDIGFDGKIYRTDRFVSLSLNGAAQLLLSLRKWFSITPRKTLSLAPPLLKDMILIQAFIVGYIDGDGCIRKRKQDGLLILDVVGTRKMMRWIRSVFSNMLSSECNNKIAKNTKGNAYNFRISGVKARKILRDLSLIPIEKLNRKWRIIS